MTDILIQILGWIGAGLLVMAALGIGGLIACEGIERLIEMGEDWING